jgi:hypothetical protein
MNPRRTPYCLADRIEALAGQLDAVAGPRAGFAVDGAYLRPDLRWNAALTSMCKGATYLRSASEQRWQGARWPDRSSDRRVLLCQIEALSLLAFKTIVSCPVAMPDAAMAATAGYRRIGRGCRTAREVLGLRPGAFTLGAHV